MVAIPKPVKKIKIKVFELKKTRKKPKGKSDVRKLIEAIDAIDSLICLIESKFTCLLCGGNANQTHHFFAKKSHGAVRFEPNNHVPLDFACHSIRVHTAGDTEELRDKLIDKIGEHNFETLKEQSNQLAERSTAYLSAVLSIKQSSLLHAVERADSSTLDMMSTAAQKRLEQVKKKFNI